MNKGKKSINSKEFYKILLDYHHPDHDDVCDQLGNKKRVTLQNKYPEVWEFHYVKFPDEGVIGWTEYNNYETCQSEGANGDFYYFQDKISLDKSIVQFKGM